MQVFRRELIDSHCVGDLWPQFLGRVELGEAFVIETQRFNQANGPIAVSGVKAGENIAVHIQAIDILPPYFAPNGGPFWDGSPIPLKYCDGWFEFPQQFRVKASPSVGNVAVLPEPTDEIMEMAKEYIVGERRWKNELGWRRTVNDPRNKHCHQDCRWTMTGSVVHFRCQVDDVGLCLADVHGYIGEGELAFAAIEVNANVRLCVERSQEWFVDWPIIETTDEIMVFSSYSSAYVRRPRLEYVDVVREGYLALCQVVAARVGASLEEANTIVATAADVRNCAIYGLGGYIADDPRSADTSEIAVVLALAKDVFVD